MTKIASIIAAVTRFLVGLVVTLHIKGLKITISAAEKQAIKAAKRADDAATVVDRSQAALLQARFDKAAAKTEEANVKTIAAATKTAALAEAKSFRRDHGIV